MRTALHAASLALTLSFVVAMGGCGAGGGSGDSDPGGYVISPWLGAGDVGPIVAVSLP